jgi:glucosamine--fructose-6-phosphate aminotransferase (isomerizing)
MCGIFGYIGEKHNAAQLVLNGLKRLEYRGYDSWGVAVVPEEEKRKKKKGEAAIFVKKKTGKIGNASTDDMPPSSFALGHTRWATHGGVTDANAHPHLDCTKTIALIHNGIIENYEQIRARLLKNGHRFISETDTEVAVHLIEEYAKTMLFSKAVQKAFNELEGLNAIIAISLHNRYFVAARNGSPLVIGFGKKEHVLASDAMAILAHTKRVHFLEDDEMAIVGNTKVTICKAKTGVKVHPKKQLLTWSQTQIEKGAFPYYMLKEIYEQPKILTDIAAQSHSHAIELAQSIKQSYGGYMIGCGSAAYACIAGSYLFSMLAKRHINWAIGSEFAYQQEFLTPKSLIIALSQSGETMDTLEAVKHAKTKGAKIVAMVNVPGSTLYREADHTILLSAGPEKAVASTKAFTAKLAHLILLANAIAKNTEYGSRLLLMAAKSSQTVLSTPSVEKIEQLAKHIAKAPHIYVIGRGLSYPASLETALKIKEISYIHAEGLAAGELKHGPLALVENKTPCITFLPDDETYAATLSGAMEMKARGGYIIGISSRSHEIFDTYLHVPDAKEATIIPNVITGQLLGYYLAITQGLDPDMPRNLAKSVTVK